MDTERSERDTATIVAVLKAAAVAFLDPDSREPAAQEVAANPSAEAIDKGSATRSRHTVARRLDVLSAQRVLSVPGVAVRAAQRKPQLNGAGAASAIAAGVLASPHVKRALTELIAAALGQVQPSFSEEAPPALQLGVKGGQLATEASRVGGAPGLPLCGPRPSHERSELVEPTEKRVVAMGERNGSVDETLSIAGRAVHVVKDLAEIHSILLALCAPSSSDPQCRGVAH